MKKILLSLFLFTAITSYSQFSLGLGSGVSSKQALLNCMESMILKIKYLSEADILLIYLVW